MTFTLADLPPGTLITWEDAAPPFEASTGSGPFLKTATVVREVTEAEVAHLSLPAGDYVWEAATLTAIPLAMVLAAVAPAKVSDELVTYWPAQA